MNMKPRLILFYDGDCGLCNSAVRFVMRYDKEHRFRFASLKSRTAAESLAEWRYAHPKVDSMVLQIDDEKGKRLYHYSKAVFALSWELGGWLAIPGLLFFLPWPLLFPYDLLYRLVARLRGRLHCCQPTECRLGVLQPDERFLP